jgi:hypothetical protein
MYYDVYYWNVLDEIKNGKLVCCTDRQKGENFYCNGMVVTDLFNLIAQADADKKKRFQFYYFEEKKEVEQNA